MSDERRPGANGSDPVDAPEDRILERNIAELLSHKGDAPRMGAESRARVLQRLRDRAAEPADTPEPQADEPRDNVRWLPWVGLALAAGLAAFVVMSSGPGADTALPQLPLSHAEPQPGPQQPEPRPDPPELAPEGPLDASVAKRFVLADGSTLVVKRGAVASVVSDRHLRITSGEVLLDVVRGQGSFVVESPHGRVVVLGTRLVVSCEGETTRTSVLRGTVRVQNQHGSVSLRAGQEGVLRSSSAPVRQPAPRLSQRTSWARELMKQKREKLDEPVRRGNLIARAPRWGGEWPLQLRKLVVDVRIEDGMVRTTLDQTFFNHLNRQLEGVYSFPLPEGAAVSRLAMYVNGKRMEGGIIERQRGRNVYESIVYRRRDPALLEWAAGNLFKIRIFPLEARREKRILLSYTQPITRLYDTTRLSVPLPELDRPVDEVTYRVHVVGGAQLELSSPSHDLETTREGGDQIATRSARNVKLGADLLVNLSTSQSQPGRTRAYRFEDPDGHYLMVRAQPELPGHSAHVQRRFVILYDTSGSRTGLAALAQRHVLDGLLRELDEKDEVAIVGFDAERRWLVGGFSPVSEVDPSRLAEVTRAEGIGHTDLESALIEAGARLRAAGEGAIFEPNILYLGDGIVTAGETSPKALAALVRGRARFLGVAVGAQSDPAVLRTLADATGGLVATLRPGEDLDWAVHDLVATLNTPRVVGLKARLIDAAGQILDVPTYLSSAQLSHGEELWVVAREPKPEAVAVELKGTLETEPWSMKLPVGGARSAQWLPRLWARQHVGSLISSGVVEQQAEITKLGMTHFLVTPHTSLLVLENERMYRRFKVSRKARTRWAPYEAPETIEVAYEPMGLQGTEVPSGSPIARQRLPIFYQPQYYPQGFREPIHQGFFDLGLRGEGFGGGGWAGQVSLSTLAAADAGGLIDDLDAVLKETAPLGDVTTEVAAQPVASTPSGAYLAPDTWKVERKRKSASDRGPTTRFGVDLLSGSAGFSAVTGGLFATGGGGIGKGRDSSRIGGISTVGMPSPSAFLSPYDQRLADLTEWVPALFTTPVDAAVDRLQAAAGTLEPATLPDDARALIERSRKALGARRFVLPDGEVLLVDGTGQFRVERTIAESGVMETTLWDGDVLHRVTPELGLWVARPVGAAEPVLLESWAPFLLPRPEHLAQWYEVTAAGDRVLELRLRLMGRAKAERGATRIHLDEQLRVVRTERQQKDSTWVAELELRWGPSTLTISRPGADPQVLTMTKVGPGEGEIAPPTASAGHTLVEMPLREASYWTEKLEAASDARKRHIRVQLLATHAATGQTGLAYLVFEAIRAQAAPSPGEVVLASRALATNMDKAAARRLAKLLPDSDAATFAVALARYHRGGPAARARQAARLERIEGEGLIAQLGQYVAVAHAYQDYTVYAAARGRRAVEAFVARFPDGPLATVAVLGWTRRWQWQDEQGALKLYALLEKKPELAPWALDAAARLMANRSRWDEAADRFIRAYRASAARGQTLRVDWQFRQSIQQSRLGLPGWQHLLGEWRRQVAEHGDPVALLALLQAVSMNPQLPLPPLGGVDAKDIRVVLQACDLLLGQGRLGAARRLLDRALGHNDEDSRLLELAAAIAERDGRDREAAELLERVLAARMDEGIALAMLRQGYGRALGLWARLSAEGEGAAVEPGLRLAAEWRRSDPDNPIIDELCADLLFGAGRQADALRHLSSIVERHPTEGIAQSRVATALEKHGRFEQAQKHWGEAIRVEPTNPTWLLRAARLSLSRRDEAAAREMLLRIAKGKWQDHFQNVVYEAAQLGVRLVQRR